ncbi:MAG TPA: translation elongation factor 4 [Patescibacteria group bacterium]|jgi:GTP-binding protein LepA
MRNIRNFCIIAHIDHGKSTLADRLLELTGTVEKRDMQEQLLDSMELERERGITIKLQPVTMRFEDTVMNLIDTPGHVDFSYEVSRTLSACEGALLLVDATQGIQAQTLAHATQAKAQGLTLIPVVNKIDLPAAEPEDAAKAVAKTLELPEDDVLFISAKTGEGVDEVLRAIVDRVPTPKGDAAAPLRALVFDSRYDSYQGVVASVRVVDGALPGRTKIKLMAAGKAAEANDVGVLKPQPEARKGLETGEIGYLVTGFKSIAEVRVGDTVTLAAAPASEPLPGYREVSPMVFAGIFLESSGVSASGSSGDFGKLREALGKLALNDASLSYEPVQSQALGQGFRAGFLGLLHLDIIRERLTREFDLELVVTAPTVPYELELTDGSGLTLTDPAELPDVTRISEIREPWAELEIVCRSQDLGAVQQLVADRRGTFADTSFAAAEQVIVRAELPLANLVADFYDQLKGATAGYGSLSYELRDFRAAPLVRLDFLVAGDAVSGLSVIVHRDEVERRARVVLAKLKEVIPPAMFQIALQAVIGGKVIARENISPRKKDVTAGLYGGDVTRKRKLQEKQKKGKARMKAEGSVRVPPEAFVAVLKQN